MLSDAQLTRRKHVAHARAAQRAQLLFVGPRFVTTSVKRGWVRPIDAIELFFISESAAESGDESNADPIAGNSGATGVFDERDGPVSREWPRPMFALWLITRCSLRMIK